MKGHKRNGQPQKEIPITKKQSQFVSAEKPIFLSVFYSAKKLVGTMEQLVW